jgi:hypothetical protein
MTTAYNTGAFSGLLTSLDGGSNSNLILANAADGPNNTIICNSTNALSVGQAVVFRSNFGGLVGNTVPYYIVSIANTTAFTVSGAPGGQIFDLSNATGNVSVSTGFITKPFTGTGRYNDSCWTGNQWLMVGNNSSNTANSSALVFATRSNSGGNFYVVTNTWAGNAPNGNTFTISSNSQVGNNISGLTVGQPIRFLSTATSNIQPFTTYWITDINGPNVAISQTPGGPNLNITGNAIIGGAVAGPLPPYGNTTQPTELTNYFNSPSGTDDSFATINLPFSFTYCGTSYSTVYVSTNGFITFAYGSSQYSGLSPSNPATPQIGIFPGDQRGYQVYGGLVSTGRFVVWVYLRAGSGGSGPQIIYELDFYQNEAFVDIHALSVPTGTQWISNGTSPAFASFSLVAGNSSVRATTTSTAATLAFGAGGASQFIAVDWVPYAVNTLSSLQFTGIASNSSGNASNNMIVGVGGTINSTSNWGIINSTSNVANSLASGSTSGWSNVAQTNSQQWTSMVWGANANLFVAVGATANTCNVAIISSDGNTWSNVPMAAGAAWSGLAYGSNTFVAIAGNVSNLVNYSTTNASSWANAYLPANLLWSSITYGNGLFLATANSTIVNTSATGISGFNQVTVANIAGIGIGFAIRGQTCWNDLTVTGFNGSNVILSGNLTVSYTAAGCNFTSGGYATSPDGINWTYRTLPRQGGWTASVYGNGLYMMSQNITIGPLNNIILTSPDAITWTPVFGYSSTSTASIAFGIVRNQPTWVITLGTSTNQLWVSTDSVNWSPVNVSLSGTWTQVAFGQYGGVPAFLLIGRNTATCYFSFDGFSWNLTNLIQSASWRALAYSSTINTWVALPEYQTYVNRISIPFGTPWIERFAGINSDRWTNFNSIAYGNGTFVAVGASGLIKTSTDGINWSRPVQAAQAKAPIMLYNFSQAGNANSNTISQGTFQNMGQLPRLPFVNTTGTYSPVNTNNESIWVRIS